VVCQTGALPSPRIGCRAPKARSLPGPSESGGSGPCNARKARKSSLAACAAPYTAHRLQGSISARALRLWGIQTLQGSENRALQPVQHPTLRIGCRARKARSLPGLSESGGTRRCKARKARKLSLAACAAPNTAHRLQLESEWSPQLNRRHKRTVPASE
jgi:hypothetical protein